MKLLRVFFEFHGALQSRVGRHRGGFDPVWTDGAGLLEGEVLLIGP